MIAHVVLFRPRADLPADERAALARALQHALEAIPFVRRAVVGRRRRIKRPYEDAMRDDFPFMATLEFDEAADLMAYLEHPAHQDLGRRIFESSESVLVYDYETIDAREIGDWVNG
jgi:hypothetical protein